MSNTQKITPAEAIHLAVRMENRAIRLYERAALVFKLPGMAQVIQTLMQQEMEHRTAFERLASHESPVSFERQAELDAFSGDLLFEGGLTGAAREGAFDSPVSLLRYALDEEERAVTRYREFAVLTQGQVSEAFDHIARQEEGHAAQLKAQLARALEEKDD